MKEKLISYLKENGKDDTWNQIGSMFNMSGEAARKAWKRYSKKQVKTYPKTNPNQQAIMQSEEAFKKTIGLSNIVFPVVTDEYILNKVEPKLKRDYNLIYGTKGNEQSNKYTREGMYVILPCVHAPFVNLSFWNATIKFINTFKDSISGIVILGDFLDMNSLSAYDKGKMPKKGISLGYEYKWGLRCIEDLQEHIHPNTHKIYIYGNHEDRYLRYMQLPDSRKLEGALKSPEDALKLKESRWDIYTDWMNDSVFIGDIECSHGSTVSRHVASKYIDNFHCNSIHAHTHRIQSFYEGGLKSFNIGSMADFTSSAFNYASKKMKKDWQNGFAVVTLDGGHTFVDQIVWNNQYKCFYYGGRKYN